MNKIILFYEQKLNRSMTKNEKKNIEYKLKMGTDENKIILYLKSQKEYVIKQSYRQFFNSEITENELNSLYEFFDAKDNVNNNVFTQILFSYMKNNHLSGRKSINFYNKQCFKYHNTIINDIINKTLFNIYDFNLSINIKTKFIKQMILSIKNNFPFYTLYDPFDKIPSNLTEISNQYKFIDKFIKHLYYYLCLFYLFGNYVNYKFSKDIKTFGTNLILNINHENNMKFIYKLFLKKILGIYIDFDILIFDINSEKEILCKLFYYLNFYQSKIVPIKHQNIVEINFVKYDTNKNYISVLTKKKQYKINYHSFTFETKNYNNVLDDFKLLIKKNYDLLKFFKNKLIICRHGNVINISKNFLYEIKNNKIYTTKINKINSLINIENNNINVVGFLFKNKDSLNRKLISTDYISVIN